MLPFLNSSPPSPSASSSLAPAARPAHHSRTRSAPALTLDLSSISTSFRSPNHAYASNTLLLTGLDKLRLFQPDTLDAIKDFLQELAPLNSFSPLPSFRRIVVSFKEVGDAVKARTYIEIKGLRTVPKDASTNETTVNSAMVRESNAVFPRVYFGETTPLVEEGELSKKKNLLELPPAAKLFFISPPPSPPAGWQMRNEDPPNKEVHASDLEVALNKLNGTPSEQQQQHQQQQQQQKIIDKDFPDADDYELTYTPASISPTSPTFDDAGANKSSSPSSSIAPTKYSQHFRNRSMSATIIYNPEDHGNSASDLPAVMVEDTTTSDPPAIQVQGETETSPVEKGDGVPELKNVKTPRPPLELM